MIFSITEMMDVSFSDSAGLPLGVKSMRHLANDSTLFLYSSSSLNIPKKFFGSAKPSIKTVLKPLALGLASRSMGKLSAAMLV